MLSTLILLYALDTGQIPKGCYIAAWTILILQIVVEIWSIVIKKYSKKE